MLRIWEITIEDANLVSRGGAHTQDDEDNYNGSTEYLDSPESFWIKVRIG